MELTKEQLELRVQSVNSLVINSELQLGLANDLAKYSNEQIKEIKAKYKKPKQELDKQKKEVLAKEKAELKAYENAKSVIKSAIGEYMKKLELARIEQEKAIQEEKEMFGISLETVKEVPKLNGTHIRKTWKARVVDESKVPEKIGNIVIKKIDLAVLDDLAKVYKGTFEVEGVEFYQDESVVIRW